MILDMEGILLGGGRADKGINKNQKNIDLGTHIVTYKYTCTSSQGEYLYNELSLGPDQQHFFSPKAKYTGRPW